MYKRQALAEPRAGLELKDALASAPVDALEAAPGEVEVRVEPDAGVELDGGGAFAPAPGSVRIRQGVVACRWAGAMLVHAFTHRLHATSVLAEAAGAGSDAARFDDVGLLAATSMAFTLGAGTVEGVKHLPLAQAGALCALARMPALSTLRARLGDLAERCDPLALQRAFATAMLTAEPATSGVYYVDDHFVPYAGAKPVGKGWDTKHRNVARGRADTYIVDGAGPGPGLHHR